MNALVHHGAGDLRVEARVLPEPGAGEVIVDVHACGICGTDLRIAAGNHRAYGDGVVRVPGHEIVGEVTAVGEGADAAPGQRVFVAPNIGCGRCAQCRAGQVNRCVRPEALGITRDGGFAERLRVGADAVEQGNLLPLESDMDAGSLSVVEPLACVLRGQRPLAVAEAELVLIMGAGPIGLMHLAVARARGAARVVVSEPASARRERALAAGADAAVDPTDGALTDIVRDRSPDGRGADVVVTAAPAAAAQQQALELAGPGGRVCFFGGLPRGASDVALDTNLIHYKELVVTGISANTNEDCAEALALVTAGTVDAAALVSHRFALPDAHEALETAASGRGTKVVIEP